MESKGLLVSAGAHTELEVTADVGDSRTGG